MSVGKNRGKYNYRGSWGNEYDRQKPSHYCYYKSCHNDKTEWNDYCEDHQSQVVYGWCICEVAVVGEVGSCKKCRRPITSLHPRLGVEVDQEVVRE